MVVGLAAIVHLWVASTFLEHAARPALSMIRQEPQRFANPSKAPSEAGERSLREQKMNHLHLLGMDTSDFHVARL